MKILFHTLGCKVNQYETQAMMTMAADDGHEVGEFSPGDPTAATADALVINSCTVTAESDRKLRQLLRRCRRDNPGAVLVVTGCMPQAFPEQAAALTEADIVMGNADRRALIDRIAQHASDRCVDIADHDGYEALSIHRFAGRTRAFVKIEDGCNRFCTYCIIPYARGPVRSLSLSAAVEQAEKLAQDGYREIVLTGIEISSWGHEFKDGTSLIDLVEGICRAVPDLRVRLGSLEPRTITEDFCRRAAALPNLCPHFHLSMQSGCDATLKRMNRKYDSARYYESVTLLREHFDRPGITTDLIVGFPGETEEEFDQTLDFVRRCAFSAMHIFPYSIRPGTKAAAMEQLPRAVKEERAARAAAVAEQMRKSYLAGCVGCTYPVLFEQPKDGRYAGHAPNYTDVEVDGENLHNEVRAVEITGVEGDILIGRIV